MTPVSKTLPFAAWMVLWLATLAAQAFATAAVFGHFANADYVAPVLLTLAATQLVKVPVAILRLRAMGRPPDDAILALVPIGNLGLAWQLVRAGEVSPERRARAEKVWAGEMSAVEAFSYGVSVVSRSIPVVVLLAFGGALVGMLLSDFFLEQWKHIPPPNPSGDIWFQGSFALTVLLGIYTIFQFLKRETASRESWIPSVFFIPMLVITLSLLGRGVRGWEQNVRLFASFAPALAVSSVRGGLLAAGFLALHQQAKEGRLSVANSGEALRSVVTRGPSLIGAHGAVVHAVTLGLQVVIPGIFYSIVYSLTDAAAFYEPEKPSLARSQELTVGIRRRIFKIIALSLFMSTLPFAIIALSVTDMATISVAIVDFTVVDSKLWMIWDFLELVATAVSTVAFAAVYEERRRGAEQRAEASPPPEPVTIPTP